MSEVIRCLAQRRARIWTVALTEFGVYAHGRTLAVLQENLVGAFTLAGVPFSGVEVVADTPGLEAMRAAHSTYEAALEEAVAELAVRRTPLRDMAAATGVSMAEVKRVLAARAESAEESAEFPQTLEGSSEGG
ncbi:hypothetical protein NE857_22415 [Nocardiopsis exhalans]|uniref:Uncharacterized protein n=1 Tax=Nocardiopsis exhalans TaxID=163604 RepID=A0ABY5D4M1_9ACTN|nr:hypothetical protein [Nocardiopsis exhalans]USY18071.1 hypothetical protein NE857_22415 [Nocardiopsis exhalans]